MDAMVRIQTAGGTQVGYHTLARGFMSTNEPVLHFGLADAPRVELLEVRWPSGHVQTFENLPVNHEFVITEPGSNSPTEEPTGRTIKPLYVATDHLKAWHIEMPL